MGHGAEIGRAIVGDDRPCVVGGAHAQECSTAHWKEGMRDGETAGGEGARARREGGQETRRAYKVLFGVRSHS